MEMGSWPLNLETTIFFGRSYPNYHPLGVQVFIKIFYKQTLA